VVVHGFGRGSTLLGFPTANLELAASSSQSLPQSQSLPHGVYAAWAAVRGKVYKAVVSIGRNPHFHTVHETIEAYIMHTFDKSFYGEPMALVVAAFLRESAAYDGIEALKEAIQKDVDVGKQVLENMEGIRELKNDAFLHNA